VVCVRFWTCVCVCVWERDRECVCANESAYKLQMWVKYKNRGLLLIVVFSISSSYFRRFFSLLKIMLCCFTHVHIRIAPSLSRTHTHTYTHTQGYSTLRRFMVLFQALFNGHCLKKCIKNSKLFPILFGFKAVESEKKT